MGAEHAELNWEEIAPYGEHSMKAGVSLCCCATSGGTKRRYTISQRARKNRNG